MAMTRRSFLSLTRHVTTFLSPKTLFPISQKTHFQNPNLIPIWQTPTSQFCSKLSDNSESKEENENEEKGISKIPIWPISQKTRFQNPNLLNSNWQKSTRQFCSKLSDESESEEENENEEEGIEYESDSVTNLGGLGKKMYTAEEREEGAKEIGYRVLGPLERSDRVFKDYEPVFAVVQIGSYQFKVSNGDCIYTERLKFCEVNDKLVLNKVLMLGSSAQTIIGRPILPDAAVHAVVEEHALDAKVIIFKKKRRKNYRRTKGHRQELTKLRITDIQGIEKPDITASGESEKVVAVKKKSKKVDIPADKKPEKVAVPA